MAFPAETSIPLNYSLDQICTENLKLEQDSSFTFYKRSKSLWTVSMFFSASLNKMWGSGIDGSIVLCFNGGDPNSSKWNYKINLHWVGFLKDKIRTG